MKHIKPISKFINENSTYPKIDLWGNCYVVKDGGVLIYEPISVNEKLNLMKIKNFASGDLLTIPFSEYYMLRHQAGTPVVYYDENGGEVSGEVVTRDGEKRISLYKDQNYSGIHERIVNPDWSRVYKFGEMAKHLEDTLTEKK